MPVVTFTLLEGQPAALKTKLGHAVHLALENAGIPKADRFHRFLELDKENFNYYLHYPDPGRAAHRSFCPDRNTFFSREKC